MHYENPKTFNRIKSVTQQINFLKRNCKKLKSEINNLEGYIDKGYDEYMIFYVIKTLQEIIRMMIEKTNRIIRDEIVREFIKSGKINDEYVYTSFDIDELIDNLEYDESDVLIELNDMLPNEVSKPFNNKLCTSKKKFNNGSNGDSLNYHKLLKDVLSKGID